MTALQRCRGPAWLQNDTVLVESTRHLDGHNRYEYTLFPTRPTLVYYKDGRKGVLRRQTAQHHTRGAKRGETWRE